MVKTDKKIIAVIPARMGASRFPGKPLAKILDLPMIEHVRRRTRLCEIFDEVYIATCDREIMDVVTDNGGKAIMTADTHERCTERVEEAVQNIDADIVAIFQGDEPLFDEVVASKLIEPFLKDETVICTSLLSSIKTAEDLNDKNIVKAVLKANNDVLYFSRAAIPYQRDDFQAQLYRQTGLSAFSMELLKKFSKLPPTPLEITESIDFLRILEHGIPIRGVYHDQILLGVDEPQHVFLVEEFIEKNQQQKEIYQRILQA